MLERTIIYTQLFSLAFKKLITSSCVHKTLQNINLHSENSTPANLQLLCAAQPLDKQEAEYLQSIICIRITL